MHRFRQVVSIKWVRQLLLVLFNIIQLNHVQFMYSFTQVVSIKWVMQLLQVLFNIILLVHVQFMYSSCTVHVQFQTGRIHQVGQVALTSTVQYKIVRSCAIHVQFMYSSFTVHVQFMYSFRQVESIKWVRQLLQVLFNIIWLDNGQTCSIQGG